MVAICNHFSIKEITSSSGLRSSEFGGQSSTMGYPSWANVYFLEVIKELGNLIKYHFSFGQR